jgi:hypothetical protein
VKIVLTKILRGLASKLQKVFQSWLKGIFLALIGLNSFETQIALSFVHKMVLQLRSKKLKKSLEKLSVFLCRI